MRTLCAEAYLASVAMCECATPAPLRPARSWNVTKWVHLVGGDVAVCTLFRKIHRLLAPGGLVSIVAQPWASYPVHHGAAPPAASTSHPHPRSDLHMRPDGFPDYLLHRVGFAAMVQATTYQKPAGPPAHASPAAATTAVGATATAAAPASSRSVESVGPPARLRQMWVLRK